VTLTDVGTDYGIIIIIRFWGQRSRSQRDQTWSKITC